MKWKNPRTVEKEFNFNFLTIKLAFGMSESIYNLQNV